MKNGPSIVLLDVSVGSIKQLLVAVQFVVKQHLPKRFFDFTFAGRCVLPAVEANDADDVVDLVDDRLDDDWRLLVPDFLE